MSKRKNKKILLGGAFCDLFIEFKHLANSNSRRIIQANKMEGLQVTTHLVSKHFNSKSQSVVHMESV